MVIGFPTDVKHVAHIGMDGPSNAPPSWVGLVLQSSVRSHMFLRSFVWSFWFLQSQYEIPERSTVRTNEMIR